MFRVLHTILNPIGALLGFVFTRAGRKIDSWFSPGFGRVVAILVGIWAVLACASIFYAAHEYIGRSVGLLEPVQAVTAPGMVTAVETLKQKKLTVTQSLVVGYEHGGETVEFTETVSEPKNGAHEVGEAVTVYLADGEEPTIEDPNDQFFGAFVSILSILASAVFFYWAWRYYSYRNAIYQARPKSRTDAVPVLAGSRTNRIPSTAERLKADELRMKRLAGDRPSR